MGLKLSEVLLILAALLLLFGKDRLPGLGQSLGSAIRNFKKGFSGEDEVDPKDARKEPTALPPAAPTVNAEAADSHRVSTKQGS